MTTTDHMQFSSESRADRCSTRVDDDPGKHASQTQPQELYAPEASAVYPGSAEVTLRPERSGTPAGGRRPRRRTGQRQLIEIQGMLSDRDTQILTSLSFHPFLLTGQIARMHFASHASDASGGRVCRRVLARLAELRAIEHLERRIGGVRAGSASFVWRLGPVGRRLLRLSASQASRADEPRSRRKEPSLHHLDHSLAIAEAHIRLLEASHEHRFELLRVQTEPQNWRPYIGAAGERLILKPDLYAVTASGDYEDSWAIEVDRGMESLPTLLRKCAAYEAYRRSGSEQAAAGVFPWVLWLMPSTVLADKLRQAVEASRTLDSSLYRITTFGDLLTVIEGGPS